MTLATHTRLGPYEIQVSLGAGGMGEVYRARDTRLDRDVAVKVLPERLAQDAQALARFHREFRAVANLSHANIVAIHDIGTDQGLTYAVMELLEGQTLGRFLKQQGVDWHRAIEIATAIADGLAAAHAKGIIHRDIKPQNIFLTTDGGVKILDFGLARLESKEALASQPDHPTLETQPGVLLGTVAYMSPEQLRGQPAEARSDLFALGCVLYEMVLGRHPFAGPTSAATMAAILHEPIPALSQSGRDRPAELDRLILRCLEKDPTRRFPSTGKLALALRSLGRSALTGVPAGQQQFETSAYTDTPQPLPPVALAPSLAVLPFRNMSADPENEYFSEGLAEELINALAKVEGLHVASRTSAFAFKGRNEDIRKIGEQLNVRTVLEGSVRKAGTRVRISAQLVNVADGYQLWSETYNRELADVFAIQDEIAHSIAKALQVILSEKEQRAIEKVPTTHVKAYEYYLRGRQFFHQFRRKGFEFALQMFARAIAIDANYALALAGIADCHSLLYLYWDTAAVHLEQADHSSRKALELDPDLAEAHVARGLVFSLQKQYAEAEREFETAIRLDPRHFAAHYFFARAYQAQGKLSEAARHFERSCQLRPDEYQAAAISARCTSAWAARRTRKPPTGSACRPSSGTSSCTRMTPALFTWGPPSCAASANPRGPSSGPAAPSPWTPRSRSRSTTSPASTPSRGRRNRHSLAWRAP
jgi:serine/threonine protein kinase/Tfp pilus assembly protein PilF